MQTLRHLSALALAIAGLSTSAAELGQQGPRQHRRPGLQLRRHRHRRLPDRGQPLDWQVGKSNCSAFSTTTPGQLLSASNSYTQASPSIQADTHGSAQYGSVGMYAHFRANASAGFGRQRDHGGLDRHAHPHARQPGPDPGRTRCSASACTSTACSTACHRQQLHRIGTQVWLNNAATASNFRAQGQGQGGFPFHQVINQDLNFNVTVKLGTPLSWASFSRASVGTAGAGPPNWFSEATSDFASTLTWQGISGVKLGGNAIGWHAQQSEWHRLDAGLCAGAGAGVLGLVGRGPLVLARAAALSVAVSTAAEGISSPGLVNAMTRPPASAETASSGAPAERRAGVLVSPAARLPPRTGGLQRDTPGLHPRSSVQKPKSPMVSNTSK